MTEQFKPKKESVFKRPNTSQEYYGKDIPGAFELNGQGKDRYSLHLTQTTDWTQIPISYDWNRYGLRGPEPDFNNDTRLLFAGSSATLGMGLPLEYTYPYLVAQKMNASYINVSDIDVFTDIIPNVRRFKSYNPTHVIISDTRFIQHYGFALNAISRQHFTKIYADNNEYAEIFKECDKTAVMMMEMCLMQMFPNCKICFAGAFRRLFRHAMPDFEAIEVIEITKDMMVDLARDNCHMGIESSRLFADKIYSAITTQGQ